MTGFRAVPLTVERDLSHGGRWTSLRGGTKEWLWANPSPSVRVARESARPGDAFVDAGGGEECLPTVQGRPDHGAVWTLPWHSVDARDQVAAGDLQVSRQVRGSGNAVEIDYEIHGSRGAPFVHAVHLLLNTSDTARLEVAGSPPMTWRDKDGPRRHVLGTWPSLGGVDFSRLGPDDGTAACLVLHGVRECRVVDGRDALRLSWRLTSPSRGPVGLVLWRNLAGWPEQRPYHSIGVEPLVGETVDATDTDLCFHPAPGGPTSWHLHLEASSLDAE